MEKQFKYEAIADHIISALEAGTLLYGEKMLSLRKISSQFSCSVSVALQAYRSLEDRGYLHAVEKSGYFSRRPVNGPLPSPEREDHSLEALRIKPHGMIDRIMALSRDESIVQLNVAVPHPSLLPQKQLEKALIHKCRSDGELLFRYSEAQGSTDLRYEISRRMLGYGVSVSAEDLLITNGCMEALSLAVQCTSSEGDIIAIETPVFFGIITLLQELNRRVVEIPVSAVKGIDTEFLEKAVTEQKIKVCIITANFQNPLGFVMPIVQKRELLRIAKQYTLTIIEDDAYGECSFDGNGVQPLKAMDCADSVIYCSSFSKSLSPGVRVGWTIPGKQIDAMKQRKYATTFGGVSLIQEVVAEYLRFGRYESFLKNYRKNIRIQTETIRSLIADNFPESLKISNPSGGFFLWIEFNSGVDAYTLFEKALNEGVGVIPGGLFSTSDKYRNCIRISCATPVTEEVVQGIKILGKIAAEESLLQE